MRFPWLGFIFYFTQPFFRSSVWQWSCWQGPKGTHLYLWVLWWCEHVAQWGDRTCGHHHGTWVRTQLWHGTWHGELWVSWRKMHHVTSIFHHETFILVILQFRIFSPGFWTRDGLLFAEQTTNIVWLSGVWEWFRWAGWGMWLWSPRSLWQSMLWSRQSARWDLISLKYWTKTTLCTNNYASLRSIREALRKKLRISHSHNCVT